MINITLSGSGKELDVKFDIKFINKNDLTKNDLLKPFSAPFDSVRYASNLKDSGIQSPYQEFEETKGMMNGLYSDFNKAYKLELIAKDGTEQSNAFLDLRVVNTLTTSVDVKVQSISVSAPKNSSASFKIILQSNVLLPASVLDRVSLTFDHAKEAINMLVLSYDTTGTPKKESKANSTYITTVNCVSNTAFLGDYVLRTGATYAADVYNKPNDNKDTDYSKTFYFLNTQKGNRLDAKSNNLVVDENDTKLSQEQIQNLPLLTNFVTKSQALKIAETISRLSHYYKAKDNNRQISPGSDTNTNDGDDTPRVYEYERFTPAGKNITYVARGSTVMNARKGAKSDLDKQIEDFCKSSKTEKNIIFNGLNVFIRLSTVDGDPNLKSSSVLDLYNLLKNFLSSDSSQYFSYTAPTSGNRILFPICGYEFQVLNSQSVDLIVVFNSSIALSKVSK